MKRIKDNIPGIGDLEVLGSWYAPFDMMMNDLGFWYPILLRTGVPTPRTIIVNADSRRDNDLGALLDGDVPWCAESTVNRILDAMEEIGYPCFFRGGQLSAKHSWKDTCFIPSRPEREELLRRMTNIIDTCVVGNIGASPLLYENWAVRALIPTTPAFTYFHGEMPIVKEARFFLKDHKIDCWHPYWPKEALTRNGAIDEGKFKQLCTFSDEDTKTLTSMAEVVAHYFYGYWSCDFLQASDGRWFCTDMAQGEDSFHYPDCPKAKAA